MLVMRHFLKLKQPFQAFQAEARHPYKSRSESTKNAKATG